MDSEDDVALSNKGESLYELGKITEGFEFILKALEIDSTDDNTWYQKARILVSMNRNDDAIDSLIVSTSINPEQIDSIKKDDSFSNIKNEPRFQKLLGNQDNP